MKTIILGPPGTGKTTTLLIKNLVKNVGYQLRQQPFQIMMVLLIQTMNILPL
jgi:stage III sporulation protein SpoIIIAA